MIVKLAAQVISDSVADAIEYYDKTLKLKQFENSEGTVRFLRIFNKLFDLLNSRNPFGKYSKAPMKQSNDHIWQEVLSVSENYILKLKSTNGSLMYSNDKKITGFIGFLINIYSVRHIYMKYVGPEKPLKYLLMYKLSQDHLELFFGSARAKGGFNNNPTAVQFRSA